ncbi:MAG: helix-turn-helix domain-containing protein [bacterium]
MTAKPPTLVNPRLASAMSHPTRLRTLRVLTEREATPREIAAEIGEPLNNVAYHIKVLKRLGCIELVRINQTRGGRVAEHVYKGTQRPYWDPSDLEQLDDAEKLNVIAGVMQHVSEDIATAMAQGTFYEHDDNHLSRTPMVVDEEGWNEVVELLSDSLDRLLIIQERVNERGASADETKFAKVAILHFESPAPRRP